MSTFSELQDEVLEHKFNAPKYRVSVRRWLNEAQNRFCRQVDVRTQHRATEIPYAAGIHSSGLPADFARKIEIADRTDANDWRNLVPMDLREFDDAPEASGSPIAYILVGEALYLYPTPSVATKIVLSYWKLPEPMESAADEPEIPSDYHYLLPYWALYRAYMREDDGAQAQMWKNDWAAELEKAKGELQYEGQDVPSQIPGTYEDDASLRY